MAKYKQHELKSMRKKVIHLASDGNVTDVEKGNSFE